MACVFNLWNSAVQIEVNFLFFSISGIVAYCKRYCIFTFRKIASLNPNTLCSAGKSLCSLFGRKRYFCLCRSYRRIFINRFCTSIYFYRNIFKTADSNISVSIIWSNLYFIRNSRITCFSLIFCLIRICLRYNFCIYRRSLSINLIHNRQLISRQLSSIFCSDCIRSRSICQTVKCCTVFIVQKSTCISSIFITQTTLCHLNRSRISNRI